MSRQLIPIIGQNIENTQALKMNAQVTTNWFPNIGGTDARNPKSLSPCPGLNSLGTTSNGTWRGFIEHKNKLYGVSGNKLYLIELATDLTPTFTEKGTVSTDATAIGLASNQNEIMIAGGGDTTAYIYDSTADTFTQITDTDFVGADDLIHISGYFIYIEPNSSKMVATALEAGGDINALDFIRADALSDDLVGLASVKGEIWAFGTDSVQVYYNAANPIGFPFSQRTNAVVDFGCSAKDSIQNFNNGVVWLDSRGYVTMASGYQTQIISSLSMNEEIKSYPIISDASALVYSYEGHLFYQLNFPSEGVSWVYDAFTQAWHKRTSITDTDIIGRHLAEHYILFNGTDIVGSYIDGRLYQLTDTVATDNGENIIRERVTQHLSSNNQYIYVDFVEFLIDTTNIPATGQGSDPELMFSYSKDGGYTYSSEIRRSMGADGNYTQRIRFNRLGRSRNFTFKLRVSDPVSPTIISGQASVRVSEE